jgi:hypothetical protein
MDAAVGGAFLSLNLRDAIALVKKRWRNASTQGGRHVVYQDGPADEEAQGPS